ncbi:hypothetical protein [Actinoplanes sp. L3-i22]|uniref:hypothetical protein n=1 Tax=Actinoplanes sp. L3-i22 TaxID=2836373 RepID=UPI001C794687|nr:hypothetical protein [Actinoplanes sp. L3-i22]BCY04939.1 hypothetical protein L3i22_000270 [Actinoplanes sp. L3-i22]
MKKTWVRKTLSVGIMAAGALLLGPVAAAQAGGHHTAPQGGQNGITQVSSTNLGALNGTQFAMPVTAPMNMNGNALALGGISSATGGGVNHIAEGSQARRGGNGIAQQSGGNVGFGNGTQISVPVTVPTNMNGNADSLFGVSSARGTGVNHVTEGAQAANGGWGNGIGQQSGGNVGILNGTQIAVPITIPINQCGNADSLFGVSSARATCGNFIGGSGFGRSVQQGGNGGAVGNDGWGHGGNAVGALGHGGNRVGGWDNGINQSSFGNIGFLNGTQFAAPIVAPINACGNSLGSLLGSAQSSAICVNRIGNDGDDVMWVKKPAKGHQHGGDVQGDQGDDCSCNDDDNSGDVRGDHGGYDNGGSAPAVNDDHGYTNDDDNGDVKGDKGGKGYGDVKDDNKGDVKGDKGGKGYGDVSPDKYGDKTGGRNSIESTPVSGLTGSLGGLDLLNSLR